MIDADRHAPPALLAGFAADPAAIDGAVAASLEAHLVCCPRCRRALGAVAGPAVVAASWEAITERIDVPRQHLALRLLERAGIDPALARILAATPALQASGVAVMVAVAAAAAAVSRSSGGLGPFLLVAPLAPLAAVAAAFSSSADPAGEAGVATPLHGVGLVVRRAVVVLGVTFALLGVATLALPDLGVRAAAWLLPGLALALGSLALGTWVRIEVAVPALVAAWVTALATVWALGHRGPVVELAVFTAAGQVASLVAGVVAVGLVVVRRDRLATPGMLR